MNAKLPRFSTVICNYNYGQFVGQAIQSALDQTYPADRLEVVVVDDGSTDDSRQAYATFAHDPRVRIVLQENRGQSAAFEAGVQAATGDFVCLLDSDDLFLPHKLARLAAHIEGLGEAPDNLFLCHDLVIDDITGGAPQRQAVGWFARVGVDELPDRRTLNDPIRHFAYSIPCGLVFSRAVVAACLEALPVWAFPRGTDGVLCPAAMLKTGAVHYLREALGVYRVHGANEFADLRNGRFKPKFDPKVRSPRTLQFLERWVDALDLPLQHREQAMDHIRRIEHLDRQSSAARQLKQPSVCVVVLPAPDGTAPEETVSNSLQSHAEVSFEVASDGGCSQLVQMAHACRRSRSDFVVFVRAGDRLDRDFVERHLRIHQHGTLVGVTCSDVRLVNPDNHLLHADLFNNSGAWKQDIQHVPPMATRLSDWVAPPMSACMFRRSAFLDGLFEQAEALPRELQTAGFWLAFQLAHHTAGALRARATMTTCRVPRSAALGYGFFSSASAPDGSLLAEPPVSAARAWLQAWVQREVGLFQRWLPLSWHQRFETWIAQPSSPAQTP